MNHESEVSVGPAGPGMKTPEVTLTPSDDSAAKPPMLRRTRLVIVSVFGGLFVLMAFTRAVSFWLPTTPRSESVDALINAQDGAQVAEGIGYLFAASLMGILAAGCGQTLKKLGRVRLGRNMAWAGLGLSICCIAGAFAPGKAGAMTRHDKQFAKSVADFSQQVVDNQASARPAMPKASVGEGQRLNAEETALKEFMEGLAREGLTYRTKMAGLKLVTWLRPENLVNPRARLETRESVAKAKLVSRDLHDHAHAIMEKTMEDMVNAADVRHQGPETRRAISEQLDGLGAVVDAAYRYDDAVFDETLEILQVMDSQGTRVRLRQGQLQFDDELAMTRYNQSIGRVVAMAAKQDALRRENEERANAANAAFRKVAETGDFRTLEQVPSFNAPRAMNFSVVANGVTFNARPLVRPVQASDLVAMFGPVERRVTDGADVRAWDSRGVYAFMIPKTQTVALIALSLNDSGLGDGTKSADFAGRFELLGTTITDVDTPQRVNKRLPSGMAFVPSEEYEGQWILTLEQCQIKLVMGPNGMLDAIAIVPKMDVSEGEPRRVRF